MSKKPLIMKILLTDIEDDAIEIMKDNSWYCRT